MKDNYGKRALCIVIAVAMLATGLSVLIGAPPVEANGIDVNGTGDNVITFNAGYLSGDFATPISGANQLYPGDQDVTFDIEIYNNWASTINNVVVTIGGITPSAASFTIQDNSFNIGSINTVTAGTAQDFIIDVQNPNPGDYNITQVTITYTYDHDSNAGTPEIAETEVEWMWFTVGELISPVQVDDAAGVDATANVNVYATGAPYMVGVQLAQANDDWNWLANATTALHDYEEIGNIVGTWSGLPSGVTVDTYTNQVMHWDEGTSVWLYFNFTVPRNTAAVTDPATLTVTYNKYYDDNFIHQVLGMRDPDNNDRVVTEVLDYDIVVEDTRIFLIENSAPATVNAGSTAAFTLNVRYVGNVALDDATASLTSSTPANLLDNEDAPGQTWISIGDWTYNQASAINFPTAMISASASRATYTVDVVFDGFEGAAYYAPTHISWWYNDQNFDVDVNIDPVFVVANRTGTALPDLTGDPVVAYQDDNTDIDLHMQVWSTDGYVYNITSTVWMEPVGGVYNDNTWPFDNGNVQLDGYVDGTQYNVNISATHKNLWFNDTHFKDTVANNDVFDMRIVIEGTNNSLPVSWNHDFQLQVDDTRVTFSDIAPQDPTSAINSTDDNVVQVTVSTEVPAIQDAEPIGFFTLTILETGGFSTFDFQDITGAESASGWHYQAYRLPNDGNNYVANLTVDVPAGTLPGDYVGEITLTGYMDAADDSFWTDVGPWYDYPYPPYTYNDENGDSDPFSYTFPIGMRVCYYPELTITGVVTDPADLILWGGDLLNVPFTVTIENTGNVPIVDLYVNITNISGSVANSWKWFNESSNGGYLPLDPGFFVGAAGLAPGETYDLVTNIDVSSDAKRDYYDLTVEWEGISYDRYTTLVGYDSGTNPAYISGMASMTFDLPIYQVPDLDDTPASNPDDPNEPIWLFKDDAPNTNVPVDIPVKIQNDETVTWNDVEIWLLPNVPYMGHPNGDPFYGLSTLQIPAVMLDDNREIINKDDLGNILPIEELKPGAGEAIEIWFLDAPFNETSDVGYYYVTLLINFIEDGSDLVEIGREYPVQVNVTDLVINDPFVGSLYLNALDPAFVAIDQLWNDVPFDVTLTGASLSGTGTEVNTGATDNLFTVQPGVFLSTDDPATAEPKDWMDMFGVVGGNTTYVWFDGVLDTTATPGFYSVPMTLTGFINLTGQPFTMIYDWYFYINRSRIDVTDIDADDDGDCEATDDDGLFYAGESFEELEIEITNGNSDPNMLQQNEDMFDVRATLSGMPTGVTIIQGATHRVDELPEDESETFTWRIDIARTVPPGIYQVTLTIAYDDEDGNSYTDILLVDFTVEYTPQIEVQMETVYIIQGEVYKEINVTFVNVGNVDLVRVTLEAEIGDYFFGSAFYWVEQGDWHYWDEYDILNEYTLYVSSFPMGATLYAHFRLVVDPDVYFGDARIGINQWGWYYDTGATEDYPTMLKQYGDPDDGCYPPDYDNDPDIDPLPYNEDAEEDEVDYPFIGTYIPIYVVLRPDLELTQESEPIWLNGQTDDCMMRFWIYHDEDEIDYEWSNLTDITLWFEAADIFAVDIYSTFQFCENHVDEYEEETVATFYYDLVATEEGYYSTEWHFRAYYAEFDIWVETSGCWIFEVRDPVFEVYDVTPYLGFGDAVIGESLYFTMYFDDYIDWSDVEVTVDLTNTPLIDPHVNNPQLTLTQYLDWAYDEEDFAFDIDLNDQLEPGVYTIPVTVFCYAEDYEYYQTQWVRETIYFDLRISPFPPRVVITNLDVDDIYPGRDFDVTFTISNEGGDTARDIYINLFSQWWEELEGECTEYKFLNNFITSISASYKETNQSFFNAPNQTVYFEYWEGEYAEDGGGLFSPGGEILMDYRNISLEELGIETPSDIVNVSLDRERMLTSPQPEMDMLYIRELNAGEEIEVEITMNADNLLIKHKPYRIGVNVSWVDSFQSVYIPGQGGDYRYYHDYNCTVMTQSDAYGAQLADYSAYIMASVVLLVIILLLLLLGYALWFGKKRPEGKEEGMFPEEEPFAEEPEPEPFDEEPEPEEPFAEEPEPEPFDEEPLPEEPKEMEE